ncbi:UDP-glucose iridoid glucosyltransferase-like [Carica papaya]|uniref:UDP-glucose iridoid glucosyltransferase-like n=1 Tax=Carica papaya TaxID=3649 RepID=UPI000B8D0B10|nr:UDP-glucose iridoid glucosyltransferase-like [Carica papaya]
MLLHLKSSSSREMEKQEERGRKLLLVPCPFQGHINPMLQLASVLHSKGFSITIAHTQFDPPNPSAHPAFDFISIPDTFLEQQTSPENMIDLVLLLNAKCQEPFKKFLAQMINRQDPSHPQFACIIYDEVMYFSPAIANHFKLPSIMFRTSSATTFLVRAVIPKLHLQGCLPLPDSILQDPVPEHYPLRFKDLPVVKFGSEEQILRLMANLFNTERSSAIIFNTMDCLEQSSLAMIQHQKQLPIFRIGPMHKLAPNSTSSLLEEDTSCIAWLDKQAQNSVIYISLGSIASMDSKEVEEMAWGLANSKQPFLWVIRSSQKIASEWIESFTKDFKNSVGERGCIVRWAPQKKVLAHDAVGGFWTHCGWNSTLESICEGVPMICRPCYGDQNVTARYVSQVWKVGWQYENELKRGVIEKIVQRLMVEEEGKEMRKRARDLKHMVEASIDKDGPSRNSLNEFVEFITSS